jgi:hypothetical protein
MTRLAQPKTLMQKTFEPSFNQVLVFYPYERLIQASCEEITMLQMKVEPRLKDGQPADAFKLGLFPDGVVNAGTCWSKV